MSDQPFALEHWVALSLIPSLGGRITARLVVQFGTPEALFSASTDDLRVVQGVGPKLAAAIRALDLDQVRADIAAWQADGITVLHQDSAGYPETLRTREDAPLILFQRGTTTAADTRAVAIVGTRRPRPESLRNAAQIATTLAEHGWTVISGLATGIDTAAHTGALAAGGRTLAVLGCGVRVTYPPENTALAARICANGALLAEVHPDAPPQAATLVARNRVISGLSCAVVVVETGPAGGSMHTARFAHGHGIPLFVVGCAAEGNRLLCGAGAHELPLSADAGTQLVAALANVR